jgi:hypothetical protein
MADRNDNLRFSARISNYPFNPVVLENSIVYGLPAGEIAGNEHAQGITTDMAGRFLKIRGQPTWDHRSQTPAGKAKPCSAINIG